MGISGTVVAKESSHIVILDDDFASVVKVSFVVYVSSYFFSLLFLSLLFPHNYMHNFYLEKL